MLIQSRLVKYCKGNEKYLKKNFGFGFLSFKYFSRGFNIFLGRAAKKCLLRNTVNQRHGTFNVCVLSRSRLSRKIKP